MSGSQQTRFETDPFRFSRNLAITLIAVVIVLLGSLLCLPAWYLRRVAFVALICSVLALASTLLEIWSLRKLKQGSLLEMKRLQVIASQFAHEMQTPLLELRFEVESFTKSALPRTTPPASRIVNATERIVALFEAFRLLIDRHDYNVTKVNLNTICESAILKCKQTIDFRVNFLRRYSPNAVVSGPQAQWFDAVLSILKIAIQATENCQPAIIELKTSRITEGNLETVTLVIQDNGPGFEAPILELVDGDGTMAKPGSASRHGLFIVKDIIEANGGRLHVANLPGEQHGAYVELSQSHVKRREVENGTQGGN